MSTPIQPHGGVNRALVATICIAVVVAAAWASRAVWQPWLPAALRQNSSGDAACPPDDEEGHDHAAHGPPSIQLTEQGLKNIGFEPFVVKTASYERSLKLPAIVVERPGRSQIHITAPLTGIVTAIHAVEGEAAAPADPLFEIRLTHEELVAAQRDFLKTSASLEVVRQELQRLKGLGEGVIAGRRILEQEYEQQKLQVTLLAERQAMLLHGLSDEQVDEIGRTKELFRNVTVAAPEHTDDDESCDSPHMFTVQRLNISLGEQIAVGTELAVLADHCELHIAGNAFADDAAVIRAAAQDNRKATVRLLQADDASATVQNLEVLYIAGEIDSESRALKVFLRLPNELAMERKGPGGKRFIEWRFKPGQRAQIWLPVETWDDQLVLPPAAVVDQGVEAYVYRQNGDRFEQVAVHVAHRDSSAVVVANDGALFPGDVLAGEGAYQLHLAVKNQDGPAVDPHAGHNH